MQALFKDPVQISTSGAREFSSTSRVADLAGRDKIPGALKFVALAGADFPLDVRANGCRP